MGRRAVDARDFELAAADKPRLASVMLANNETGVLRMSWLAARSRPRRLDALRRGAGAGQGPVDFRALGVHGLTLSAHKIRWPAGRRRAGRRQAGRTRAAHRRGGQERNLRSGTENVMAIVGFGKACELAVAAMDERAQRSPCCASASGRAGAVWGARISRQMHRGCPTPLLRAGRHRRRNPGRQARPGRVCGGERLGLFERQSRAVPHPADGDGRRGGPGPRGDPGQPRRRQQRSSDIDGFLGPSARTRQPPNLAAVAV